CMPDSNLNTMRDEIMASWKNKGAERVEKHDKAVVRCLKPATARVREDASRYTFAVISACPGLLDDSEIDLPPSDGPMDEKEGEEPASDPADTEDLDPVPADAATDVFDDRTGEDDPVDDEELDPVDDGGLDDEAGLAREADLDEVAEFPEDRAGAGQSLLAENDELGVGNEDFGIAEDDSSAHVDGGEEGPRDPDEELREEDLPSLDADDQGDGEEEAFYELEGEGAPPPFPWDEERWPSRSPGRLPAAVAVVSIASGAIAIGGDPPKLWGIVDDGVESSEPTGAPREGWRSLRLARKTGELFIETDAGIFVSRDGGRSFEASPTGDAAPMHAQSLRDMEREIAVRGFDLRSVSIGAAIVIDEAGTILAGVSRKTEGGTSYLVRFSASAALGALTVGSVGGMVWDLSWDEPRRRLWVASDAGVSIFAQPQR
ncbi:MAG: hypothetical protein ACRELY_15325, partial [Polyangiaceae bacterium]